MRAKAAERRQEAVGVQQEEEAGGRWRAGQIRRAGGGLETL